MYLDALVGYVFAVGMPVWLVVEQLVHAFKVPSNVPGSLPSRGAEKPLRQVA
jgi:hypothetical protein